MIPSAPPDRTPEEEELDVPGFRSWSGVYLFVFGWFVAVVIALAIFTRVFS